jgi:hypothetical protein
MIIGLIGINCFVAAEGHTPQLWLNAGYNSTYLKLDLSSLDDGVVSSFISPHLRNESPYFGIAAEYSLNNTTTLGAHLDFTQSRMKAGFSDGTDEMMIDSIITQSVSPTVGLYSSYLWNQTIFSLGVDLANVQYNEVFSLMMEKTSIGTKPISNTIWLGKVVVSSSVNVMPHTRATLSAFYGPSSEIISLTEQSSAFLSELDSLSLCESGIKVSLSYSLDSLLNTL